MWRDGLLARSWSKEFFQVVTLSGVNAPLGGALMESKDLEFGGHRL